MIADSFADAFTEEWVATHIQNTAHEFVILRQVIPWQAVVEQLAPFYDSTQGRVGKSLRTMVALLIISRLRQLSDEQVVEQVKENRYMQYFCNVPDEELSEFINPSSLCRFRQRLGSKGIAVIESSVFLQLRQAGIIDGNTLLMDSTVLENDLIHPNDVRLVYQALGKMAAFARRHKLQLWWDEAHLKKRWRAFGRSKTKERTTYLAEFYLLFVAAFLTFRCHLDGQDASEKDQQLLAVLELLRVQTEHKLAGERHIENRLVSLDEIDARPIKKGKAYPTCEFGSTLQMTFNRQGFMITTENFIGQPGDATLYPDTLERFQQRMQGTPETVITDLGFRSRDNFKATSDCISNVFLGRSEDVITEQRDFCHKARSATEGFIAVAKNLRGFGKSLYKRLTGDRIWTRLCQVAYNLKKFMQLYRDGKIHPEHLRQLTLTT